MKVNLNEYRDKNHILEWFIIAVLAGKDFDDLKEWDGAAVDIVLTVNGREVPFVSTMERLEDEMKRISKEDEEIAIRDGRRDAVFLISEALQKIVEGEDND